MGGSCFTYDDYSRAKSKHSIGDTGVTTAAEQKAYKTGLLDLQVDPATNGVIRLSKPRFLELPNGLFQLEIGIPMPVETRLDTTGSMGDNVDMAMAALPKLYGLCSSVLPGYELQLATGIFGDIQDRFVLCRPKFANSAERLVERLTLMVPEHAGGDTPEDPQYGIFGGAYLTDARISKYGLKGYDFTVSDAPGRDEIETSQLIRIFGEGVFEKTSQNGFSLDRNNPPSTKEAFQNLSKRAHAFFIQINVSIDTNKFWTRIYGRERVVILDDINYLPHIQALIIGLTEGSVSIVNASQFLIENGVPENRAREMAHSVAHIPIGAQAELTYGLERQLPKKDDIFQSKTDLWPIDEVQARQLSDEEPVKKIEWL